MFPDPMFEVFFVFFFIIVAVSIVFSILRAIRSSGRDVLTTTPVNQQIVKETEIIREIVKIRCSYCGNLYDETEDKCPHCGGNKT
jgi:rubrerythrin